MYYDTTYNGRDVTSSGSRALVPWIVVFGVLAVVTMWWKSNQAVQGTAAGACQKCQCDKN